MELYETAESGLVTEKRAAPDSVAKYMRLQRDGIETKGFPSIISGFILPNKKATKAVDTAPIFFSLT